MKISAMFLNGISCFDLKNCPNLNTVCLLNQSGIDLGKIVEYVIQTESNNEILIYNKQTGFNPINLNPNHGFLQNFIDVETLVFSKNKFIVNGDTTCGLYLVDNTLKDIKGWKLFKILPYCSKDFDENKIVLIFQDSKGKLDTVIITSNCGSLTDSNPFTSKTCPNLAKDFVLDDGRLGTLTEEQRQDLIDAKIIRDTIDIKNVQGIVALDPGFGLGTEQNTQHSTPYVLWSQTFHSSYKDTYTFSFRLVQEGILERRKNPLDPNSELLYSNRQQIVEKLDPMSLMKESKSLIRICLENLKGDTVLNKYYRVPSGFQDKFSLPISVDSISFYRISIVLLIPETYNFKKYIVRKNNHKYPSYDKLAIINWALSDIVISKSDCNACCPFIPGDYEYQFNCEEQDASIQANNESYLIQNYSNYLRDSLTRAMIAHCSKVKDKLDVVYQDKLYAVTLYYYDQVGNLIKTIPPKGVHPLSKTEALAVNNARINGGNNIVPFHKMASTYLYNSLNQLIESNSPDANKQINYYDPLGRVWLSQKAKQRQYDEYSYLIYDALNRVSETGVVKLSPTLKVQLIQSPLAGFNSRNVKLANLPNKKEVVTTYYDSYPYFIQDSLSQYVDRHLLHSNSRGRVSSIVYRETNTSPHYDNATHYVYDIHGYVAHLIQDHSSRGSAHRFKTVSYDYDLISAKVNQVSYQEGQWDAFYHRYQYDADNRLSKVMTSLDGRSWKQDVG
ncbi:MAG: hypothetical protein IPL98_13090 [Saprospiraceae bacterium]|nr:hypothetical protein [Saprospiraceae bacterium]